MCVQTLPSCNLGLKRRNAAGLPSCCDCHLLATARSIIARAQSFISHRSKAQAEYPCLTSCLPDVRPCKRKPPADLPSRLGAFYFAGARSGGQDVHTDENEAANRRRPIGDEQRSRPRVQLERETGPEAATARPGPSAASNSERSCSFSLLGLNRGVGLKPQIRPMADRNPDLSGERAGIDLP
jgi:hypothetical protein